MNLQVKSKKRCQIGLLLLETNFKFLFLRLLDPNDRETLCRLCCTLFSLSLAYPWPILDLSLAYPWSLAFLSLFLNHALWILQDDFRDDSMWNTTT